MICHGSGIEIFPDDDGDLVCPWCSTLLASDMNPQREAATPEHEAPAAQRKPCLRCQALEDALVQAATKALEWRDAARLAAAIPAEPYTIRIPSHSVARPHKWLTAAARYVSCWRYCGLVDWAEAREE